VICPNCGAENAQGAPYCYNCANPLPQAGATPPGTPGQVPPGSVPPPSYPPGGTTVPGGVPPAAPPPQWPGGTGGQPPFEPPKAPKSTISAGLGGLIAFLVVAGIGAILFFTVFNKKDKAEPQPPPPTTAPPPPTTAPPPPTTAPPVTTPPVTTGGTTTPPVTTGGTTTPPITTGPTTPPVTTGGVTTPPVTTGNNKPPKAPTFFPFFCKVRPTQSTTGAGCQHNATVSSARPFFFVIRGQNIPKGAVFTANFVLKGTTTPVGSVTFPPANGQRINRFIANLNPVGPVGRGLTLLAVVRVNGQAVTCGGAPCKPSDLASVTFT
jgi:hypothetical protein